MKKTLIILSGIFCWFNVFAGNLETLQDSALNYYLKSDYSNALRIYENLNSQNYYSAELYYNLGNCYYNTGDLANSIFYYEKALILNPGDKDIQHNLQIANAGVKSKVNDVQEVFYKKWFNSINSKLNSDKWALMSIIFFLLTLAGTGTYFFSRKMFLRKTGFISGIFTLFFSIIFLIFATTQLKHAENGKFAIVFEDNLVKSSPSEESTNLFEISEGLKVEVSDTLNDWANIKLADGKEGWIKTEYIKRI